MNTLKSAALIVVLLGVLYGVFMALSKPELAPGAASHDATEHQEPLLEFGPAPGETPQTALPPPPLMGGHGDHSSANPANGSPRAGTYQPGGSADSLAPPTMVVPAVTPPLDPVGTSGSELQRSAYETPATSTPADPVSSTQPPESPAALNASSPELPPTSPSGASVSTVSLRRDWQDAAQLVEDGKFRAALAKLSPHSASADLASDQRAQLVVWLDALAAKVIYSPDHLLGEPHRVRKGEVLFDVAKQYNVSWMLLKSINHRQVNDPMVLVPGTDLKVVPGPFHADVNLATSELTLFVGELYAGRFPFGLGDQPPQPGQYKVSDKQQDARSYYGLDGRIIAANDPANPYGGWWISLGGEVCIHGSPLSPTPQTLGCISLSPQDAKDVYSILSMGSEVTVRR